MKEEADELIAFFKTYLPEFRHDWLKYLTLFTGMSLGLVIIVIPIFSLLASWIMQASGIAYISYNNLTNIVTVHFLGAMGLLLLLLVILFVVYLQFVIQFVGVQQIQTQQASFAGILREAFKRIRLIKPQTLLFFLFYFLLILPFGAVVFSTPFLAKIKIPAFTMEFFFAKWQNMLILAVFYLVVFTIGQRFLLTLPLVVLKQIPVRTALRESLHRTRNIKTTIRYSWSFAIIGLVVSITSQALYYGLYGLQLLFDKGPNNFALIMGIVNLILIEAVINLARILTSMLLFSFLIREIGFVPLTINKTKAQTSRRFKIVSSLLLSIVLALLILVNYTYLSDFTDQQKVLTISHRGVDDGNGVQNTIPALELTAKEHPDYVEMDIQETKDRQFVVMHDANLKTLTDVNATPQSMTLSDLTKLTVRENGKVGKVASFDAYLAAATKIHQKLLIEIKTSPQDSNDLLQLFVDKYGRQLLANDDMVHSLDYKVITGLKELDPKIPVSFILPFNVVFPTTPANAYTMEETTLDDSFVENAHAHHQTVYAWTVNDPAGMKIMLANNVDGIITDNLNVLKQQIKENQDSPNYADRLNLLFSLIPAPSKNSAN